MENSEFLKQLALDFDALDDVEDVETLEETEVISEKSYSPSGLNLESASSASSFSQTTTGIIDSDFIDMDDLAEPEYPENDESLIGSVLPSIATNISFNFDDFDSDILDDESNEQIEESSELATLQDSIAKCEQLGFPIADKSNKVLVLATELYASRASNEVEIASDCQNQYTVMLGSLTAASSLNIPQKVSLQKFKSNILKSIHDPNLKDAGAIAINDLYDQVLRVKADLLQNGKRVEDLSVSALNLNATFNNLLNNTTLSSVYIATHEADVRNFIASAAAILVENTISDTVFSKNDTARRESAARVLTSSIYSDIDKLKDADVACIKHIDAVNGGNLMCTCGKCGAKTKVDALMRFVFYQESSITQQVFPVDNRCSECGSVLAFPKDLYPAALSYFCKNYAADIHQMFDKSKNFSRGVNVITITPALEQLPQYITCIASDEERAYIDDESKNNVIEVFDSDEFRRAVDEFYKHIDLLNGMTETKETMHNILTNKDVKIINADEVNSDSSFVMERNFEVQIPEVTRPVPESKIALIAANVAQIAGVDYTICKGKALISLITYLEGNSLISKKYSFDTVIAANLALEFVEQYRDSTKFDLNAADSSIFANLMAIAGMIDNSIETPSDKNEVKTFLLQHSQELQKLVSDINQNYSIAIKNLEVGKYSLACLPISDYKQTSLYSLMNFMPNKQIFDIFNEICDRMIINNYAEAYFDYWCRMNLQHVATLKLRMQSAADTAGIKKICDSIVQDVFSAYGMQESNKYFSNILVQSMSPWDSLKELSDLMNNGEFYKFCEIALHTEPCDYGFGPEFAQRMQNFFLSNISLFRKVTAKSETEFYLGDMFSAEELASSKEELSFLVFGRYIPKRKPNESISEYIVRFKQADVSECKDNLKLFESFKDIELLYFGAALTGLKCNNFRVVNFMAGTIDSVINSHSDYSLELLGVSKLRFSILMQHIKLWDYSSFDADNADVISLLNGYYFTDVSSAIVDTFAELTKQSFSVDNKDFCLRKFYDFETSLMSKIQNISVSDAGASDVASMIEELRLWEYTKGYTERFAGE